MINSVRQTVVAILNKSNYGYITPADFNLYAKQAQLEIFDEYFYDYNNQITKENTRRSGVEYANISKSLAEVIDSFSVTKPLAKTSLGVVAFRNNFYLPSIETTGDDEYMINKVVIYTKELVSGSGVSVDTATVRDASKNFVDLGVSIGDLLVNASTEKFAYVLGISSSGGGTNDILSLSDDIFDHNTSDYRIYASSSIKQADRVLHGNITLLNNSMLTKPSLIFPSYTQEDVLLSAFPESITDYGQVVAQYIRYPKDPNWTFTQVGGNPIFNGTAVDYQDFELPLDDEYALVHKILQYSGMSIREIQVTQFAQAQEQAQSVNEQ